MRFPRCVLGLTRRVLGHTERVLGLTEGAAGVAEHEISDPSLTPHHTLPEFESKAWEEFCGHYDIEAETVAYGEQERAFEITRIAGKF